jgi:hypothetical protein
MFSKLRIIIHQPVTRRILEDFFVDRLIAERIDFLFYDLTSIYHKELKIAGESQNDFVIKFDQLSDFEGALSADNQEVTLYIPYFIYEFKVINAYRILTKYNCKLAFFGRGVLPSPNIQQTYFQIARRKFNSLGDPKFIWKGISRLYTNYLKKKGHIKKFDIIFNAGNFGYYTCGTSFELFHAQIVPFNSRDYSRFLRSIDQQEVPVSGRYAVFLDEYLPYHPDVEMMGMKTVEAVSYYNSLNRFFETIEVRYNITVVIAAHPKSDYKENPYEGRMLIKDKTENLIKNSEFVIDHFSTAISYAILNYKPLLLIYTNSIKEVFLDLVEYAYHVSKTLDVDIINIDKNADFRLEVNTVKYNDYRYGYLTMPEAESRYDEDIFIDFFKS